MDDQKIVGRYSIEQEIDREPYAAIYRAQDTVNRRLVRLFVFEPQILEGVRDIDRFLRLLQQPGDLVHPHIAWVWQTGHEDGRVFTAARYVDGVLLQALIEESGPMSWQETLAIITEIAGALDFAHGRGFDHGDVSPRRVTISPQHGAVLMDFGLKDALTRLRASGGSPVFRPEYPPPEEGEARGATPAADQFGLACLWIEMLTGRSPYVLDEPGAQSRVEIPADWQDDVPPGFEDVLRRALNPDPTGRYPDSGSLLAAVERLDQRMIHAEQGQVVDDLARRRAAREAREMAEEQARRDAEEAARLAAIEAARREIEAHLERAADFQSGAEGEEFSPEQLSVPADFSESESIPAENVLEAGPRLEKPARSRRLAIYAILALLVVAGAAGGWALLGGRFSNAPAPTGLAAAVVGTPTKTLTRIPTTPTVTATALASATSTSTASPSPTTSPSPTSSPRPSVTPTPRPSGTVTITGLALRSGPDTNHPAIGSYPAGTQVFLLGRDPARVWVYVEGPDGATGWMYGLYIDLPGSISDLPEVPIPTVPVSAVQP